MHVRCAVVVALLALVSPTLAAQDSLPRATTFVIGAGVNLDGSGARAPALLLGREWRSAGSRFSLRLAGEYTSASSSRLLFDYSDSRIATYGSHHTTSREASISALTTFALSTGRIQPYLISGLMMQKQFIRSAVTYNPGATLHLGSPMDGSRQLVYRSAPLSIGAQAGLGVRTRVGRGWIYSELRAHVPDALAGQQGFSQRSSSPFTFGIQFD